MTVSNTNSTPTSGSPAGASQLAKYNALGSTATALAGAITTYVGSRIAINQIKQQEKFLELQKKQEEVRGLEIGVALRNEFLKNISSARASTASRGIVGGEGSARAIEMAGLRNLQSDIDAARYNTNIAKSNIDVRKAGLQFQRKGIRAESYYNISQSLAQAVSSGATYKSLSSQANNQANKG